MLTGSGARVGEGAEARRHVGEGHRSWELNEAFAAVVLRYLQILSMPHDKINVNGGAIAMGHPLGATGHDPGPLLDELERRNLSTGLANALRRRRHGHRDDHRARLIIGARHPPGPRIMSTMSGT